MSIVLKSFNGVKMVKRLTGASHRRALPALALTTLATLSLAATGCTHKQRPGLADSSAETVETATNNEIQATERAELKNQDTQDSSMIRLALKYVSYKDTDGQPVVGPKTTSKVIKQINELYAPCKIQFINEEFAPVDPAKYGFEFNTQSMSDLTSIRSTFKDHKRLVVINTGEWNHDTMGVANAWTSMPGGDPVGIVIESTVATFAGIVAHELGHYLSLDHQGDSSNLMNAIIYSDSTDLADWQCREMREAAREYWSAAMR